MALTRDDADFLRKKIKTNSAQRGPGRAKRGSKIEDIIAVMSCWGNVITNLAARVLLSRGYHSSSSSSPRLRIVVVVVVVVVIVVGVVVVVVVVLVLVIVVVVVVGRVLCVVGRR